MRRFRVAVVHGVNLDQLGRRDPGHYGGGTFRDLERQIADYAGELQLVPRFFQTNHEGALVEYLHRAEGLVDGIVINPGAWTHYAWAIRDALELAGVPAVEVHLSDVSKREPWRHHSVISALCVATITGKGPAGYREALELLRDELRACTPEPEPAPTPVPGPAATATPEPADEPAPSATVDDGDSVEQPEPSREEEAAS